MVSEADFYSVLKDIAVSLRQISQSLRDMSASRKAESKQFVSESRRRERNGRLSVLNEGKRHMDIRDSSRIDESGHR